MTANAEDLQRIIQDFFPRLWPPTEAALATALALVIEDVVNPPTCILTGAASSEKTTVLDLLSEIEGLTYRSDHFTPKVFVTHAANVSHQRLAEIDLLPRIKHKVLITPELAPMFRQREEVLRDHFARLTAVLDGHGFTGDSGTQGRRGYTGDFLFAWLGAATPLPVHVWSVMAQLGSRLHFYEMPDEEVTDDELEEVLRGTSYREKMRACGSTVRWFLRTRFSEYNRVRGVRWDREHDPEAVLTHIKRSARLLARCRSLASTDEGPGPFQVISHRMPNSRFAPRPPFTISHGVGHWSTVVVNWSQVTFRLSLTLPCLRCPTSAPNLSGH